MIDELHPSDIQGEEMEDESGVTARVIDDLRSWAIQGDQKEGESDVTRSIIEDLEFPDIQRC